VSWAIRPERPEDRDRSLEIERLAFGSEDEVAIVEGVRDDDGSFALVAEQDGDLLGHVQLSRAWIGDNAVLALGPIGVLPDRQGQGIGSALIWAALEHAKANGETAVILLGSQAFYPRFGFEPASGLGWRNPFAGEQPDGFVISEEDFMVAVLEERARLLRRSSMAPGVRAGELRRACL
jgi:putative acetyltransferase